MNTDQHYLKKELYELFEQDSSIFEFIHRGSSDGIWYWDMENPEHEWMSPQFWKTLGYDPHAKKHLASEWQDLIKADDLQAVLDNLRTHCADPAHPYEQVVRYRHNNGSAVWVHCQSIAIRDKQNKPVRLLGTHTVLTPKKQTKEELHINEQFLTAVFDSIHDGISVLDQNLCIVRANRAIKDLYPLALPLKGKKCYEVYHGRTDPCDTCPTVQAFKTAKLEMNEIPLIQNGKAVGVLELFAFPMLDDLGNPTAVIEFSRDISERKQKEQSLIEREIRYRTLFESSVDALTILDVDTGKFVHCNQAAVQLHDVESREALIGTSPSSLSPEFQPSGKRSEDLAMAHIEKAFANGSNEFEWIHTKADGTPFPVRVTLSAIPLGEQRLVLAMGRDLTDLKNVQAKREKLIEELRAALDEIKTLQGILPMCSFCKKIRNDKGYWEQLEAYLTDHTDAKLSHSLCPDCLSREYPDVHSTLKARGQI